MRKCTNIGILIIANVSESTLQDLREEYSNSLNFSDGEIFRNIRLYAKSGDQFSEARWWARLSYTKRKDLRQLLKHEGFSRHKLLYLPPNLFLILTGAYLSRNLARQWPGQGSISCSVDLGLAVSAR